MNRQQMATVLAKGKALAPDRFPAIPADSKAAEATLDAWREALSVVALPEGVWLAAVTMWATSMVGDRMVTPRDLIAAAYAVRDRWEQHPERRQVLDDYRLARLNANYERMGLERVERGALERGEGLSASFPSVGEGAAGVPQRLGELAKLRRPGAA